MLLFKIDLKLSVQGRVRYLRHSIGPWRKVQTLMISKILKLRGVTFSPAVISHGLIQSPADFMITQPQDEIGHEYFYCFPEKCEMKWICTLHVDVQEMCKALKFTALWILHDVWFFILCVFEVFHYFSGTWLSHRVECRRKVSAAHWVRGSGFSLSE